jgi:hypothetical protein
MDEGRYGIRKLCGTLRPLELPTVSDDSLRDARRYPYDSLPEEPSGAMEITGTAPLRIPRV